MPPKKPKRPFSNQQNRYKIFLIRGVSAKVDKITLDFAFYSRPIFQFNDDDYLCFFTTEKMLVNDVKNDLKNVKIHVDTSQILATGFDYSISGSRKREDQNDLITFYVYSISKSILNEFSKLVYGIAHVHKCKLLESVASISTTKKVAYSLIPLLKLFGVSIAFNLGEVPAVFIESLPENFDEKYTIQYFKENVNGISIMRKNREHSHGAAYYIEFEDKDMADSFCQEYQDKLIGDSLLYITPFIDEEIYKKIKKTEIQIPNLDITPMDRKEFRIELEEKYGPIFHIRIWEQTKEGNATPVGKCAANVIFYDEKDGLRALYDKDYNITLLRTKIWMFNLPPDISEQEIINYFPDDAKPIKIKIYPQSPELMWWGLIIFPEKSLKEVTKAAKYLKSEERGSIRSFIPFGYMVYHGGELSRKVKYTNIVKKFMRNNSIFIENTENVTVEQIIFFLESNGINDIHLLYVFPKDDKNDEVTVVTLKNKDAQQHAMRMLQDESIEGQEISLRDRMGNTIKRLVKFPLRSFVPVQ